MIGYRMSKEERKLAMDRVRYNRTKKSKEKLRKKYLDPDNNTHKAQIYRKLEWDRRMFDCWRSTLRMMGWAYYKGITDYLRRLRELKAEGLITNRERETKDGKKYAEWRALHWEEIK